MTDQELLAPELPEQRDPSKSDLVSGWYKIAQSDQISLKEALQVDNFPTQMVVWRGEDSVLRGLDLYCKHMGASLACGEVEGNSIRCPFHNWRWAGEGHCDEIPYAKNIPSKALTRAWEIDEIDGEIYAWFDKNASPADPNGQRFK
ncbi:Rieske 2Fe-2S domain-containing protein [Gammaproteobacteria bacterium]|nr:Rieske 2Fe-2S domain-containing protein [Gammaproteobacteria bacterium]MDB9947368.1 Rieske 2Fe-2S domain-containing protein [Gammaproteobacteria bacterium]